MSRITDSGVHPDRVPLIVVSDSIGALHQPIYPRIQEPSNLLEARLQQRRSLSTFSGLSSASASLSTDSHSQRVHWQTRPKGQDKAVEVSSTEKMAPAVDPTPVKGPHPSFIQVAKPFVFQQQLQGQLVAIGVNPSREDTFRIQGVQWINEVRTVLQLPVQTFCTAVCYFHKFRLSHKDTEYNYVDAAAAALFTACKIEDTLKKSKEILCAAHNLRVSPAEHLSPDDMVFDGPSKVVIGLERLMLEASGFDFRSRFPQKPLIKLAKDIGMEMSMAKLAYNIMLDSYKTFAPIKQTSSTMAFACAELATLITEQQEELLRGDIRANYERWGTQRSEILETLLDLLDLYTHFQKATIVGPEHVIEKFIQIRLKVNQEVEGDKKLSRYTEWHDEPKPNGRLNVKTPKTPITPASPSDVRTNGRDGVSPATLSPRSSGSSRKGMGARGQDGTVRFMLDVEQAKQEKETVAEYYKTEYEEYEVEVEEPIKPERDDRGGRNHYRNGRDDRSFHHNKRRR